MSWGKGIVLSFGFFAVFIGVLVTVCIRQNINLVSKNYYNEELNYQRQIDQLSNWNNLEIKPVITVTGRIAEIHYRDFVQIENGKVSLVRPSDPVLDETFDIPSTSDPTFKIDISNLAPGKYNLNFSWTMKGKEYLSQQLVVL